jgi:hypothetical protein
MTKYIALIVLVAIRIGFQPAPVKKQPVPFSVVSTSGKQTAKKQLQKAPKQNSKQELSLQQGRHPQTGI